MPASGIYVIANTINGKVYIGKTARNIKERWTEHKSKLRNGNHNNHHLQNSWNKYGEKAFKFLVLEYCPVEQLDDREIHHIAVYKERDMCYNLTDGGDGVTGIVLSEESRLKISETKRGKRLTEEQRRRISEGQMGRVISQETRNKISAANTGKVFTEEHRRKIGESQKDRVFTEEHRRNISNALQGKKKPPRSDEHRRKMSEANKGKTIPEETRRKMSESHRRNKYIDSVDENK